jgi:L-amino acid N-acyltransferase YncA
MGCARGKVLRMSVRIDALRPEDWEAICKIFVDGMATGLATFETEAPTWGEWDTDHLPVCRLAARLAGRLVGWAVLSPVSRRAVYAGVAEVSIYVAGSARGQGVGKALLSIMTAASEEAGIWTLQAAIFTSNLASIALHRSCGFREVGRRERIARRGGAWHDTVLMERRSRVVGQ